MFLQESAVRDNRESGASPERTRRCKDGVLFTIRTGSNRKPLKESMGTQKGFSTDIWEGE